MDDRKAATIADVFADAMKGQKLSPTAEEELLRDDYFGTRIEQNSGIATIYAIGSLVRRKTWLDAVSGLVSYSDIKHHLTEALNNGRVRGIMLQIDSFGGEAGDCFELADYIRESRATKPIWGCADIDALSAGYALLSACERCFVAPRGSAGSIGAVIIHCERSRMNDAMGITYTVLRSAPQKALGTSVEPLPEIAAEKYLASLKKTGQAFADLVARNRPGLSRDAIIGTEGQWYDAEEALALNLVDGVRTFDNAFAEFADRLDAGISPEPPPPAPAPIEEEETDMTTGANNGGTGNPPAATNNAPAPGSSPAPAVESVPAPGAGQPDNVISLDQARGQERATYAAYVNDMTQTCELAGAPQRLGEFLRLNLSVADARKRLLDERAAASAGAAPDTSNTNAAAGHASQGGGAGGLTSLLGNRQGAIGGGGIAGSLAFDTASPMSAEQSDAWDKAFSRARGQRETAEAMGRR